MSPCAGSWYHLLPPPASGSASPHLLQAGGSHQRCWQPAQMPTTLQQRRLHALKGLEHMEKCPRTPHQRSGIQRDPSPPWPGGDLLCCPPASRGCSWPPGEASHRASSGGGHTPAAPGRTGWDQPLLLIKIDGAVQISRLSGVSITYHSISCNKLWMSLHGGVVLLNLLGQPGWKTTEEAAEARRSIPSKSAEIAAVN